MKHILIKTGIVAAAMFSFAACDNSELELDNLIPDEYKRVVSIKDTPSADMELFDVGVEMKSSFTIIRSGGDPSLEAATSIRSMTQEELATYGEEYVLVDPLYYTIPSEVDFAPNQGYEVIDITFTPESIVELRQMIADLAEESPEKAYYVAIQLEKKGETTVNDEKYYILRRLVISDAQLQFNITGDATFKGKTMDLTVSVPFDNDFDVAWDIEFESASVEADNGTSSKAIGSSLEGKVLRRALPLEAITNADVKTLEPGINSMSYTVNMPEGTPYGTYYFNVKFGNASLNGAPIETNTGDLQATIRFDYWPDVDVASTNSSATALADYATVVPQADMTFVPESQQNSDPAAQAIDGDVSNKWENNWGGGYGTKDLPFNGALDLGSEQTVTMVEIWRRNDNNVKDLASVECYAAESIDYSNKENIKYTNLTYLGKLDFEGSNDRVRVFTVPTTNTRYLLFYFGISGRGNGGTAVSIADMCVWTPKVAETPEDPENPENPEETPETPEETPAE